MEACVNLGALLKGFGKLPEALEAYQWASERCPGDPEIHYRLGVLRANQDGPRKRERLLRSRYRPMARAREH